MPKFETVDEYAEHIRRTTGRLSSQAFSALGTSHPIALAIAALHEEAADLLTGREMEREHAEIEHLDLSALPAVSASSTSPFEGE